jgi:hypothetical protein
MHVKNWPKFQHFKNRRPLWIKLYRDLLDDEAFYNLAPESAKVLMLLWLLASEDETKTGTLPSIKKIAFRLRISEKSLETIISNLSHWLIQDDITVISPCRQDDIAVISPCRQDDTSEKEKEKEKEKERDSKDAPISSASDVRFKTEYSVEEIRLKWNAIDGTKCCKAIVEQFQTRINTLRKQHNNDWWDKFFVIVKASPFLTGRVTGSNGKESFCADLYWATSPKNLTKIIAGNYDSRPKPKPRLVL